MQGQWRYWEVRWAPIDLKSWMQSKAVEAVYLIYYYQTKLCRSTPYLFCRRCSKFPLQHFRGSEFLPTLLIIWLKSKCWCRGWTQFTNFCWSPATFRQSKAILPLLGNQTEQRVSRQSGRWKSRMAEYCPTSNLTENNFSEDYWKGALAKITTFTKGRQANWWWGRKIIWKPNRSLNGVLGQYRKREVLDSSDVIDNWISSKPLDTLMFGLFMMQGTYFMRFCFTKKQANSIFFANNLDHPDGLWQFHLETKTHISKDVVP